MGEDDDKKSRTWRCRIGWHDWQWRILWGVGPGDNMDAKCSRCGTGHIRVWVRTTGRTWAQRQATRLHPIVARTSPPFVTQAAPDE